MTITFENDSDVIVYALEKIISFAEEQQYLFVANCTWWIAGIIGLDSGLVIFIDNLQSRQSKAPRTSNLGKEITYREVSEILRDIAREVSLEDKPPEYIPDPLRRTRKGRINPLPQTKTLHKMARKAKRFQEAKRKEDAERKQLLLVNRA
jgi:hypothetical protein